VLRDQPDLFGSVASDPTAWRVLSTIDEMGLVRLRQARARARELAWAQRLETRGQFPESAAAGQPIPGLVLDLDASVVIRHLEKESAAPTWKHTFGCHPLFCFLDATGAALAGMLPRHLSTIRVTKSEPCPPGIGPVTTLSTSASGHTPYRPSGSRTCWP
jgi:hypothetical protein